MSAPPTTWTVRRLQAWSAPWLQQRGVDTARLDSDLLLANALGVRRLDLFLDPDRPVTQNELALFKKNIQRRARREPVAYILGHHGFWQQEFIITADVLVPRPETELLVTTVLAAFPPPKPQTVDAQCSTPTTTPYAPADQAGLAILEIGVGSGALLCSLLLEYPNAYGFGIDISAQALAVAARNAERHGCLERLTLLQGDLIAPLGTTTRHFQVVVSNPPYIATQELAGLEPEVRTWEPRQALDGGSDGLAILRRLPDAVAPFLHHGGLLAVEIGATQGEAVSHFMATAGYQEVTIHLDFGRRPRVVTGKWLRSTDGC